MQHLLDLLMLIALQAVLGFDNLLYISLESKRVRPESEQQKVRRLGIGIAIALRIILLFVVVQLVASFTAPWFAVNIEGVIEFEMKFKAAIVLLGGAFILYTATKEILHMLRIEDDEHGGGGNTRTPGAAIFWIVAMNLVFSFDSILSAMAITEEFFVMATAIVISGVLMIVLADRVASFLQRNRMYEVLGLFILFVVGIMLVTEGGHEAGLVIAGNEVHAMTKTTFYFVIAVLVVTDVVQSRYQKKLQQKAIAAAGPVAD